MKLTSDSYSVMKYTFHWNTTDEFLDMLRTIRDIDDGLADKSEPIFIPIPDPIHKDTVFGFGYSEEEKAWFLSSCIAGA